MQVFTAQASNGVSTPFLTTPSPSNPYTKIIIEGELAGGTVVAKEYAPNGELVPVSATITMDTPGSYLIDSAPFYGVLELEGVTGTPALNAWVQNYADALAIAQQLRTTL